MLYVKIMSGQDMPDANPWKEYTIVPIQNHQTMKFAQQMVPEGQVGNKEGERYGLEILERGEVVDFHYLTGNSYVMNEAGKTIASHGC